MRTATKRLTAHELQGQPVLVDGSQLKQTSRSDKTVRSHLAKLEQFGMVMRHGTRGGWSLTETGQLECSKSKHRLMQMMETIR